MSPVLGLCCCGSGDKGMMVYRGIQASADELVCTWSIHRANSASWVRGQPKGSYPQHGHRLISLLQEPPWCCQLVFHTSPRGTEAGCSPALLHTLENKMPSCLSPHTHPTPTALPRHREQSCALVSKQLLYKISITTMQSDCGVQICINLFNLIKHLIQSAGKSTQSLASISYPLGSAP